MPEGIKKPPVIVMAAGLACERDFGLPAFAEHFAENGMAVFLFDYRYFGVSEGEPRNMVSYRRQLQDWETAIQFVHSIPDVNAAKMALWGSSYSGGHVICLAARHPELAAISVHVPFADGLTSVKTMTPMQMVQVIGSGWRDVFHCLTFRSPYYIPVVGQPGSMAVMNSPGMMESYLGLVPEGSSWENKLPARFALKASFYRPTVAAKKVKCPVLLIMGSQDNVIDTASIRKMAGKIKDCTYIEMPMGHLDSYSGELFTQVAERQSMFLQEKFLS